MSWNDNTTNLLKKYWSQGFSASQIAEKIGNVTRNAVIGKAHRLKLESRSTSKKSGVKDHHPKNNFQDKKNQKLGRKAKFKALLLSPNFEKENPIQIQDLNDKTCRWPSNHHPGDKDFYFCGRTPMEQSPYCQLHTLYAFTMKNEKEEDKITEEDIPAFIEKKIKVKSA